MITRKRVAAGRAKASRWEISEDGEWIGDLVYWVAEQQWEWQPASGEIITGASEAEVLLASGLAVRAGR